MQAEQIQVDKFQKKAENEWRRISYNLKFNKILEYNVHTYYSENIANTANRNKNCEKKKVNTKRKENFASILRHIVRKFLAAL